jgi:hypothetical protein
MQNPIINLMTFIGFYFLFCILQLISIFKIKQVQTTTSKNGIKIIMWLVVGGSSDNFHTILSL